MTHDRVVGQSQLLAGRLTEMLRECLPGDPMIIAVTVESRVQVISATEGTADAAVPSPARLPLFAGGERVGWWTVSMQMLLDHSQRYLKTVGSALTLVGYDRRPVARLEYDARNTRAPVAHWHFHGERGALSYMLATARQRGAHKMVTDSPHTLSDLHFPVGGERFRPSLEDFVQFLISECGVDHAKGWATPLAEGREVWRRMQLRAVIRDGQAEAATELREHGWKVEPPDGFEDASSGTPALTKW